MKHLKKGIVASGHPLVSAAAAEILRAGGNAFDAVVCAGFAGAAVEMCLTSLGGGGFLLARTGGEEGPCQEIFFDFFVDTPGRGRLLAGTPHFYPITVAFGGTDQQFNIGLGSVAVPGTLKGLLHVHRRLGCLPLKEILAPAIILAREHEVNAFQAMFFDMLRPIMLMSATGKRLLQPGKQYVRQGGTLRNLELAAFLEDLPSDQGRSFYEGEVAGRMAAEMTSDGGLLSAADLAAYTVYERPPLKVPYRDRILLTCPPPSLGGTLIGMSLLLSSRLPRVETWGSGEYLLRTTKQMQEVERLREQGITSPERLEAFLATGEVQQAAETIRQFSRGTTHVSVADRQGNVASMTCSNGEGSGYFAPGTGIMLNNMMGEDDLHPEGFHSAPPGERVGSMMSPSVLVGADGANEAVIGSGGSKRIRTAIIQVLTQLVDFERPVAEAVQAPRTYWDGECLQMEPGFTEEAIRAIRAQVPVNLWQEKNVYFGGVHTVLPGVTGAGDDRRGGAVEVVE
ncbi:MAG: gamma-glutamyltransferase [Desulfobulbus propionicus]|nr:MAG: gamma-glutamyltransferase [Desulfobulbus propionicus]